MGGVNDLKPGRYKNTNTGIEFDLYIGPDEVIIESEYLSDGQQIRRDKIDFWFNLEVSNTYEYLGKNKQAVREAPETKQPQATP